MPPFVSESQRRFLWAKHPEVAKKWSAEYGTPKSLPAHVDKRKYGVPKTLPQHVAVEKQQAKRNAKYFNK